MAGGEDAQLERAQKMQHSGFPHKNSFGIYAGKLHLAKKKDFDLTRHEFSRIFEHLFVPWE